MEATNSRDFAIAFALHLALEENITTTNIKKANEKASQWMLSK